MTTELQGRDQPWQSLEEDRVPIPEPRTVGQDRSSRIRPGEGSRVEGFDSEVNAVAFLLSLVLFIGVCGILDSRLSWPPRPTRGQK